MDTDPETLNLDDDDERETVLEGWTKDDKFQLLQALKVYGSHDIGCIQKVIPFKTDEQIKSAIAYYKKKALNHPVIKERKKKYKSSQQSLPRVPLVSWAKYLTDSLDFDDLQTETANALRLIAEFENIPLSVSTDYIDFKKIYHLIANAMDGKSLQDDKIAAMILNKCLVETALVSKEFIRTSTLRGIVENVNVSETEANYFPNPTVHNEHGTILHLASQRNYNPLNILDHYLTPSKVTK